MWQTIEAKQKFIGQIMTSKSPARACEDHHLTLLEREKILFFSGKGYSLSRIAEEVGRSKATISRELRRNSQREEYIPLIAEQKYEKRRKKCRRRKRLADPVLYELVREKFLEQQWSPEQIEGRLRLENYPDPPSYKTIYRAIYAGMPSVMG